MRIKKAIKLFQFDDNVDIAIINKIYNVIEM
jgi:hypothetical protein